MSDMEYIRRHYHVPAYRGRLVHTEQGKGWITGARGPYLRVKIDGEKKSRLFHPLSVRYSESLLTAGLLRKISRKL